jgi:hypothetical protein
MIVHVDPKLQLVIAKNEPDGTLVSDTMICVEASVMVLPEIRPVREPRGRISHARNSKRIALGDIVGLI